MAAVTCPCGTRFEASSPRAVYCSPKCRKRGSRAGVLAVTTKSAPTPQAAPDAPEVSSVVGAVIADLSESGALRTPAGLAAVKLAQLIDGATLINGASPAAWVREMRSALAEAKQDAPAAESDPIDELERKRAARGA